MNDRPTVECDVETLVIRVPMKFKKRGGRKEIIVPDGLSGARPQKPRTQEPLLTALARAFHWQELILVRCGIYRSHCDRATYGIFTPAPGCPSSFL